MVQGVIIGKYEQNNLSKETYSKPSVEDSMRGSQWGNIFQRFGIGKVVKVNRSQNPYKTHLLLWILQVNQVHLCKWVGLEHWTNCKNLISLDCCYKSGNWLSYDDKHTTDRTWMFWCEWSCDTSVTNFYVFLHHESHVLFSHHHHFLFV